MKLNYEIIVATLLLSLSGALHAQGTDPLFRHLYGSKVSYQNDTIFSEDGEVLRTTQNALCDERGHVPGLVFFETAMATFQELVDTDSVTVIIYHNPNERQYNCQRCGKNYKTSIPTMIDTIWVKPEE